MQFSYNYFLLFLASDMTSGNHTVDAVLDETREYFVNLQNLC